MTGVLVPVPRRRATAAETPCGCAVARAPGVRLRALLVLCALAALLAGCGRPQPEHEVLALSGATMGTRYSVQMTAPPAELQRPALAEAIQARLDAIDALMSTYRADSELSRFNASASTDWVAVSPELVRVLGAAQRVSRASGGAFDVTVGPLVDLWGFGPAPRPEQLPDATAIAAARARVGWQRLALRPDPPALRKSHPELHVDLSAIAKGYAVDRVAAVLEEAGLSDYLVEIGGELRARGVNGRGAAWRIAIERPEPGRRAVFRVVALRDLGMATSGDYRNFFELGGQRYSHTVDPATGRPVEHQLVSVTVLAEAAMLADAWATALLVLGPERGARLADSEGLAAALIRQDGDGFVLETTPAFDRAGAD